jgi:hypothetical protein
MILLDKNLPSSKLAVARPVSIVLSQQTGKTEENSKNYVKKNGTLKFKIKCESENEAYLCPQPMIYESFSAENKLKLNHPLNYQNISRDSNHFGAKQLEFETPTLGLSQPLCPPEQFQLFQQTYFGNYFPERNSFSDKIFLSKIFNQNLESIKNFYLTRTYPNLFQIPIILPQPKDIIKEPPKEKESIIQIKPKEKIQPTELIELNFNIPDDFLVHYQITNIEVKLNNSTQSTENLPKIKKISFQDMEIYINNLCQKGSKINLVQNENSSGEEYIELEAPLKEENLCDFLHKKRKISLDKDETYPKGKNKSVMKSSSYRKHPLKKKHKKINKKLTVKLKNLIKLNNKKNGLYTCVNLNQIQIDKTNLENFPFHPLLNAKEITKISFLKGITENKNLIRINKKLGLTKDIKSNKCFNNRRFKIEYQNKNDNTTYNVHISGIHILYLILYYYFQIHKSMKQINIYHYSHSASKKSIDEIKKIENIIKNCNTITKEISIGTKFL